MDGSNLRAEIVESQKFKVDLLKWKLILVAGLGAVALGFLEKVPRVPLLLALVPPVCIYVDIVCYHNDLRIAAIASFLRTERHGDEFSRKYEWFCQAHRKEFGLENFAMYWATFGLSALVATWPWFARQVVKIESFEAWKITRSPLLVVGLLGVIASSWVRFCYRTSTDRLEGKTTGAWKSGAALLLITCLASLAVAGFLVLRALRGSAEWPASNDRWFGAVLGIGALPGIVTAALRFFRRRATS